MFHASTTSTSNAWRVCFACMPATSDEMSRPSSSTNFPLFSTTLQGLKGSLRPGSVGRRDYADERQTRHSQHLPHPRAAHRTTPHVRQSELQRSVLHRAVADRPPLPPCCEVIHLVMDTSSTHARTCVIAAIGAGHGRSLWRPLQGPLHAKARELAEHGRDGGPSLVSRECLAKRRIGDSAEPLSARSMRDHLRRPRSAQGPLDATCVSRRAAHLRVRRNQNLAGGTLAPHIARGSLSRFDPSRHRQNRSTTRPSRSTPGSPTTAKPATNPNRPGGSYALLGSRPPTSNEHRGSAPGRTTASTPRTASRAAPSRSR